MIKLIITPIELPILHVHIYVKGEPEELGEHKNDMWDFDPLHKDTMDLYKEIHLLRNISLLLKDRNKKIALLNFHDDFIGMRWISRIVIKSIPFKVEFDQSEWNDEEAWEKYMAYVFDENIKNDIKYKRIYCSTL
jgi:hypothetical protein